MDTNNNSRFQALLEAGEEQFVDGNHLYQDITRELEDLEDTDTEDEEVLSGLLETAPLTLEEVPEWIGSMTRYERQHWDQWVEELHTHENALVALGFTHADVQAYLADYGFWVNPNSNDN